MSQENLDPHAEGYVFSPVNSVTGFFDSHDQLDPAVQSLREAGFGDQDVGVFGGEEGAQTLDLSGQRHGFAVQLWWRQVEAIFSDQEELHQLADQTLRAGAIGIGVRPMVTLRRGRRRAGFIPHQRKGNFGVAWHRHS
jgi:hypothetical protein